MIRVAQHFEKSFPLRVPEWILTAMMTAWGVGVLAHPDMFAQNPAFNGMLGILPQVTWGLIALILGVGGLFGLGVNGFWVATPFIRAVASAGRAFLWTQIEFGLLAGSGLASTGVYIYVGLLGLEIWNIYRAMKDARDAVSS